MKLAAASGFGVADICHNTDVCLGINPALEAGFFTSETLTPEPAPGRVQKCFRMRYRP